jgi:hypothetical protein
VKPQGRRCKRQNGPAHENHLADRDGEFGEVYACGDKRGADDKTDNAKGKTA